MAGKRISELDSLLSPQGSENIAIDDNNQLDASGNPTTKKLAINTLYANAKIIEEPQQNSTIELQLSTNQYSDVLLFINGIVQRKDYDYTLSGDIITLVNALEVEDNILVIIFAG